ncbi:hypothetical protein J3458_020489 [Metarhizium acridum]|nr:hypothetical protein J3458_020489 [Metarhizium acridum]
MRYLPTLLLGASSLARNETAGSIFKRFNSSNWCGPVTHGSGITSVEGTWTVPEVFLPKGGWLSERYQFYQWVGLDGTRDCGALLQGGTGQTVGFCPLPHQEAPKTNG